MDVTGQRVQQREAQPLHGHYERGRTDRDKERKRENSELLWQKFQPKETGNALENRA